MEHLEQNQKSIKNFITVAGKKMHPAKALFDVLNEMPMSHILECSIDAKVIAESYFAMSYTTTTSVKTDKLYNNVYNVTEYRWFWVKGYNTDRELYLRFGIDTHFVLEYSVGNRIRETRVFPIYNTDIE